MKVFKFGGASCNSVERIQNIPNILKQYHQEQIVMIVSAMGKTTNALEQVVSNYYKQDNQKAKALLEEIKEQHLLITKSLLNHLLNECNNKLYAYFSEIDNLLLIKPSKEFDYYYDQIVSTGELLSTCIISFYLNEAGIENILLDVRNIVKTDNNFRDATILWEETSANMVATKLHPSLTITQGFIGSTNNGESTTLGREGSDYSAAIFANILHADSLTIWKDVEGVMNADPKAFADVQLINELSFNEVIEMSYYGAQVIHPKTIKPLQNKEIPLYVKSFLDSSLQGTVISAKEINNLPPIIVIKEKQVLIHLHTKDFSFVGEKPIAALYKIFSALKIKPNLIQTGAISIQICLDNWEDKIEQLTAHLSTLFTIQKQIDLELLTIRHYTKDLKNKMLNKKNIILLQQTKETIQALYLM
ncbi:MAG: aspartate kinase [Chitinophagaceae bacterium]|nr:aspartate kinase [Chitinophagaceae bacterium]MCW5905230.1 aspartate kinase [Chitinophagaceae bacterium]